MKVLAVNSSPKMDKGNTDVILAPFLDGMKSAGAEVDLIYTRKLNISPCQGGFACWFKTPGECFQKDDMQAIIPKLSEADVWVLATPLYVDGMTGPMKNFIDRCLPLIEPSVELQSGHSCHPLRDKDKLSGKIVLVSNCGLWELDNFDPLVSHVKAICRNMNREFVGALLRPHGGGLREMVERAGLMPDIVDAAREAGHQLAAAGEISTETLNIISQEKVSLEKHLKIMNKWADRREN